MQYKLDKPVHGKIGTEKYQCTMQWRNGQFIADEPVDKGGTDVGPDPYTLLLSSLASCTLITLRMYVERKGWNIPEITVNTNLYQEVTEDKTTTVIDRDIIFSTDVDDEQQKRLMEIAKHCPISKLLENDVKVRTFSFNNKETEKHINYANDDITVVWKPELCQHSQRCWRQLPEVFDYKAKPWITPNGASTEKVIDQVHKCPSGALTYFYNKAK